MTPTAIMKNTIGMKEDPIQLQWIKNRFFLKKIHFYNFQNSEIKKKLI